MARQIVTLSLNSEGDAELLKWLDQQANKSEAIREALREHLRRNGITLGDVYAKVCELERRVKAGAVVVGESSTDDAGDEPPDVAAALDALGSL